MRTLIVGNAKTGTTALLYMIAQAGGNPRVYMEEPASTLRALPRDSVAKLIFEQESEAALLEAADQFDHKILLLRDPRDTLVSQLLFSLKGRADLLADDAFLATLLAMLQAKQEAPDAIDLMSIAKLFPGRPASLLDTSRERAWRYANFVARRQGDWQVLYYEDLVAGNLRGLRRTLGLSLAQAPALPPEYAHVARSKRSGDWQHWFTERDVAALRPAFGPLLEAMGYEDQWPLPAAPVIAPAHAQHYLFELIEGRRRSLGLPPYRAAPAPAPVSPCCNICGGDAFGPGPNGRSAASGALPRCLHCNALERQRIVQALLQAFPPGFLDWRHGLQFSPDPAMRTEQLRTVEVAAYTGRNSHDMQAIRRPDGAYDFLSFHHVLEFVPDDMAGFDDMARLLSARGMMLATFSTPLSRPASVDYAHPSGPHAAWHLYGMDVAERFQCAQKGLTVLAVEGCDPCTGAREMVHFFLKDQADAARITTWLRMSQPDARVTG